MTAQSICGSIIEQLLFLLDIIAETIFSVNEKKSYKSSTSTGSIIGRGIVGGVLLGGVGALAGATTAKKNTIEKVDGYTIRITMRGFDKPDIKIHTMFEDYMEEVTSVLKKVIDYNEKKYNI